MKLAEIKMASSSMVETADSTAAGVPNREWGVIAELQLLARAVSLSTWNKLAVTYEGAATVSANTVETTSTSCWPWSIPNPAFATKAATSRNADHDTGQENAARTNSECHLRKSCGNGELPLHSWWYRKPYKSTNWYRHSEEQPGIQRHNAAHPIGKTKGSALVAIFHNSFSINRTNQQPPAVDKSAETKKTPN